jgi:hypothetical protein
MERRKGKRGGIEGHSPSRKRSLLWYSVGRIGGKVGIIELALLQVKRGQQLVDVLIIQISRLFIIVKMALLQVRRGNISQMLLVKILS